MIYLKKLLEDDFVVEYISLNDCVLKTQNIIWRQTEDKYNYIDLSSVSLENKSIVETNVINKDNAPSRAQQIVYENDVLFGTTRPLLKRFCIVPKEYNNQICSTGYCVLRANIDKVLPKWVYYNITTDDFSSFIEQNQKGASYPMVSDSDVKKYKIPILPIEIQLIIVNIIEKFDILCNSLTSGLPKEIELVGKQYNYYRNKLLSFKEKKL